MDSPFLPLDGSSMVFQGFFTAGLSYQDEENAMSIGFLLEDAGELN